MSSLLLSAGRLRPSIMQTPRFLIFVQIAQFSYAKSVNVCAVFYPKRLDFLALMCYTLITKKRGEKKYGY